MPSDPRTRVGAGNSAVVVDLPRCQPMLSPRVPNLVPIPGPWMQRETPGQRPRPNNGHPHHRCALLDEWVTSSHRGSHRWPPSGGPLRLPQTPPLGGTLPSTGASRTATAARRPSEDDVAVVDQRVPGRPAPAVLRVRLGPLWLAALGAFDLAAAGAIGMLRARLGAQHPPAGPPRPEPLPAHNSCHRGQLREVDSRRRGGGCGP